jgi:hypothetical protein
MLAQNFKTPIDLGISDADFEGLVKALSLFEGGQIPENKFGMARVILSDCKTPSCICGWAHYASAGRAFPLSMSRNGKWLEPDWGPMPAPLQELFTYGRYRLGEQASASQAAIALRNYLTFGEPRWAEAMAD